jgi:mono/diheme cytochrome c family protein
MAKFSTIASLAALAATLAAAQAPSSAVAARKILEKRCQSCHGSVQMSGLDLRQRETMLKGGARGPAVKLGNAGESILFQAAARIGDLKMPPGKDVLAPDDLQVLRKWIEAASAAETASLSRRDFFLPSTRARWCGQRARLS